RARNRAGLELAGPSVATILALRCRRIAGFLPRPRSTCWASAACAGFDEDGAKVVDIGQRRSGDDEVVKRVEKTIGVVSGKGRLDRNSLGGGTRVAIG